MRSLSDAGVNSHYYWPTLGHLFPAIHGGSAQTKDTVLFSIKGGAR